MFYIDQLPTPFSPIRLVKTESGLLLDQLRLVVPTAISGGVDISEVPGCHLL